jgi:dinuclear metal center YbgI/SA1388 family protein
MSTWHDIARCIEHHAPLALQEDYDNSGLQVAGGREEVSRVLIALDVTEEVVAEAASLGAEMIVSHHPLLFRPLKRLTEQDYIGRTILMAVRAGITLYAAHTNLDNAAGGVNYVLAETLGLHDVTPLAPLPAEKLQGLTPEQAAGVGSGVLGTLPEAMSPEAFAQHVKSCLAAPCVKYNTAAQQPIRRVALCGGAGASLMQSAVRRGADAFVTGEVGYHPFFGHPELLLVEAGHFETERRTCELLARLIRQSCPDVECLLSTRSVAPVSVL